MLPGDRLVCAFVEPQTVGAQFKTWLLHVTIVTWFRLDDGSAAIARGLEKALQTIVPFEVIAGGEALFGPKKSRLVRLLQASEPLAQTEAKVRSYLHKKRAFLLDEMTQKHYSFRPHVTEQGEERLRGGDTFRVDQLYIVQQKGDYKEVVSKIALTEPSRN